MVLRQKKLSIYLSLVMGVCGMSFPSAYKYYKIPRQRISLFSSSNVLVVGMGSTVNNYFT